MGWGYRNEIEAASGNRYIPFDGPIDIDYLLDIPNADVARRALEFLDDQVNEITLQERHGWADMQRMWKGVLRACIGFGVPLRPDQQAYARVLGIELPR